MNWPPQSRCYFQDKHPFAASVRGHSKRLSTLGPIADRLVSGGLSRKAVALLTTQVMTFSFS